MSMENKQKAATARKKKEAAVYAHAQVDKFVRALTSTLATIQAAASTQEQLGFGLGLGLGVGFGFDFGSEQHQTKQTATRQQAQQATNQEQKMSQQQTHQQHSTLEQWQQIHELQQTQMLQQQQEAQAQQGGGEDPNAAFLQAEQMKAQVKMQSDAAKMQLESQKALADNDLKRDQMAQDLLVDAAKVYGEYGTSDDVARIQAEQDKARMIGEMAQGSTQ